MLLIDLGSGSSILFVETVLQKCLRKLWDRIKDLDINVFYTDYCMSYAELISQEKHLQSEVEIFAVEGYNSRIRHYLC